MLSEPQAIDTNLSILSTPGAAPDGTRLWDAKLLPDSRSVRILSIANLSRRHLERSRSSGGVRDLVLRSIVRSQRCATSCHREVLTRRLVAGDDKAKTRAELI